MKSAPSEFAERMLHWQLAHGRQHLPWQQTRDPYRVWLSEIMLQQTQVTTVLGYYARFLERFPDVQALAAVHPDEVMALWSGLGYYSRARNLHRCAQQVVAQHAGAFPRTAEELARLPGIGRSTAGAIAAFCHGQRVPILDANVRRVLTRLLGFGADLSSARNERLLWNRAEALLPHTDLQSTMPRYTQALMDLGASLCAPRNPSCDQCPVQDLCVARQEGAPERYPVKTRRLTRRAQPWWLLVLRDAGGRHLAATAAGARHLGRAALRASVCFARRADGGFERTCLACRATRASAFRARAHAQRLAPAPRARVPGRAAVTAWCVRGHGRCGRMVHRAAK